MTTIIVNAGETINASDLDLANGTNYIINGTVIGDLSVNGNTRVEIGSTGNVQGSVLFGDGNNEFVVNGGRFGPLGPYTNTVKSLQMGEGDAIVSITDASVFGALEVGTSPFTDPGVATVTITGTTITQGANFSKFYTAGDYQLEDSQFVSSQGNAFTILTQDGPSGAPAQSTLRINNLETDFSNNPGSFTLSTVETFNVEGQNRFDSAGITSRDADPVTVTLASGATYGSIRSGDSVGESSIKFVIQGPPAPGVFASFEGDSVSTAVSTDTDIVGLPGLVEGIDYQIRDFVSGQIVTYPNVFTDVTGEFYTIEFLDGAGVVESSINIRRLDGLTCFCSGTMVATQEGDKSIESLRVGDKVLTLDNGVQEIRWIGASRRSGLSLSERPNLRPIKITAGALGPNQPSQDLFVSRQHRIMMRSIIAERLFNSAEIFVPACKLLDLDGVEIVETDQDVVYWHILLDNHEVVFANGTPSETLFLTNRSFSSLSKLARQEILELFPNIIEDIEKLQTARPSIERGKQVRDLTHRVEKNHKPLVESHPFSVSPQSGAGIGAEWHDVVI